MLTRQSSHQGIQLRPPDPRHACEGDASLSRRRRPNWKALDALAAAGLRMRCVCDTASARGADTCRHCRKRSTSSINVAGHEVSVVWMMVMFVLRSESWRVLPALAQAGPFQPHLWSSDLTARLAVSSTRWSRMDRCCSTRCGHCAITASPC